LQPDVSHQGCQCEGEKQVVAKSFRITAHFDLKDFDTLNIKLTRAIDQGVHRVALKHEGVWKKNARRDTGSLADSIHVDQGTSSANYTVKDNVRNPEDNFPYGPAQELGTGVYAETFDKVPVPRPPIEAKGWGMAFEWKGEQVFAQTVQGTPASHAARDALTTVMPQIPTIMAGVINAMNAAAAGA